MLSAAPVLQAYKPLQPLEVQSTQLPVAKKLPEKIIKARVQQSQDKSFRDSCLDAKLQEYGLRINDGVKSTPMIDEMYEQYHELKLSQATEENLSLSHRALKLAIEERNITVFTQSILSEVQKKYPDLKITQELRHAINSVARQAHEKGKKDIEFRKALAECHVVLQELIIIQGKFKWLLIDCEEAIKIAKETAKLIQSGRAVASNFVKRICRVRLEKEFGFSLEQLNDQQEKLVNEIILVMEEKAELRKKSESIRFNSALQMSQMLGIEIALEEKKKALLDSFNQISSKSLPLQEKTNSGDVYPLPDDRNAVINSATQIENIAPPSVSNKKQKGKRPVLFVECTKNDSTAQFIETDQLQCAFKINS